MAKHVYSFGGKSADGDGKMKELLGGKGANLAEMCKIGIPVPPGFTITTEVCAAYYDQGKKIPEAAIPQINEALAKMETAFGGKKFGDPADPLLVSVRSGAALSMPGMMNTILNLGLTDASVEGSPRRPATPASPTTAIAASSTCSAPPRWASSTRTSSTRSPSSRRRRRSSSTPT